MSASNKKKQAKTNIETKKIVVEQKPSTSHRQTSTNLLSPFVQMCIIATVSFLLYANTLTHDFCQDDAIVITDNMFTQKGISGISDILKYDTFYGFFKEAGKANLVAGGRYRPFSLILFAIEFQIFGKNPFVFHLINVLLFSGLCVMLYKLISRLVGWSAGRLVQDQPTNRPADQPANNYFAFFATLLFAVHPIHTEVVANIKGADEILALLLSVCAVWFSLKGYREKAFNLLSFALSFLCFFCALLSKENAITFVLIVPLIFWFFLKTNWLTASKQTLPYLAASFVFLMLRGAAIGNQFGGAPSNELMNNPFLKLVGDKYIPFEFSERFATIFYTLGKYILLLIFPHPLTHDYYPRHIGIMSFSDVGVLLSLVLYVILIYIMIRVWKQRSIISFSIAFYLITLGIVSNIIFPVGTNMAERFLFMPSLGFCLVIGYWLSVIGYRQKFLSVRSILLLFYGVCVLLGIKTFARNFAWKDNYTLFTTDISTSENSAKLQCSVGGETLEKFRTEPNENIRNAAINEAIGHLKKSLEIHPTYKNPPLLLGNAYLYLNNSDSAIYWYKQALAFDPNFKDAKQNLALAYRDAGKTAGQNQNINKSIDLLNQSLAINPNDGETYSYLGTAYGMSGQLPKCIESLEKALAIRFNDNDKINLITAYKQTGNLAKANELAAKK